MGFELSKVNVIQDLSQKRRFYIATSFLIILFLNMREYKVKPSKDKGFKTTIIFLSLPQTGSAKTNQKNVMRGNDVVLIAP
jgi:hypothetical protein